jgi:hypothetical protein
MEESLSVSQALGRVLAQYVEEYAPEAEFDPEWPSPCVVGEPEEGEMVRWQPIRMGSAPTSENLE